MIHEESDIVALLKKREAELAHELARVRTALTALSAPVTSTSQPAVATAVRRKPGRPAKAANPAPKPAVAPTAPAVPTPTKNAGKRTVLERIQDAVRSAGRPLRVKELLVLVGATESTLTSMLQRGRREKRLVRVGTGIWSVPGVSGDAIPASPRKKTRAKKAAKKTSSKKASKASKKAPAKKAAKKAAKKKPAKKKKRKASKRPAPVAAQAAPVAAPPAI